MSATSLRSWLSAEVTTSTRQASAQRFYFGWLKLKGNPLALFGLCILLALVVVAILVPLIAPIGPNDQSLTRRLLPPSAEHWFGTDELGRDVFARIVWGSRITLYISCLVAVIAASDTPQTLSTREIISGTSSPSRPRNESSRRQM